MPEVQTMTIPIKFTKCFYKDNISQILDKNPHFEIQENFAESFKIYKYKFDNTERFDLSNSNNTYSKLIDTKIYVYDNSYMFISSKYEVIETKNKIENLGLTAYRVSHITEITNIPDDEIIKDIYNSISPTEKISFLQPDGHTVKRYDFTSEEYMYFLTSIGKDKTKLYSFIFYYLPLLKSLNDCSESYIKDLNKATYGNAPKYSIKNSITPVEIEENFTILPSKTGVGLIATKKDNPLDFAQNLYLKYLESLQTIIHFEIKSKEFNREMDNGEYKNLDELNKSVRKEMRKAVHVKYDIKNCLNMNNREMIFYGKFLTAIKFDETLTEFIEICHSIEKEIRAEIDKREEEHDKRFDKILSLVAVFAIISVFKDGSDLILSFIDAMKDAGSFSASNLVSLISPFLSVIVIFVLIKIFNKRK